MKVKFGSLNVELIEDSPSSRSYQARLTSTFGLSVWSNTFKTNKWTATLDGPWYSDSSPEAQGTSPEEAVAKLAPMVQDFCERVEELKTLIQP